MDLKIARTRIVNVKPKSGLKLIHGSTNPTKSNIMKQVSGCLDDFGDEPIEAYAFYCLTRSGWWNTRVDNGNVLRLQFPELVKSSLTENMAKK